jgi:hypothetical protein
MEDEYNLTISDLTNEPIFQSRDQDNDFRYFIDENGKIKYKDQLGFTRESTLNIRTWDKISKARFKKIEPEPNELIECEVFGCVNNNNAKMLCTQKKIKINNHVACCGYKEKK